MNTSLRRISVMIMALVVLLLANATLTQVFTADGLRSDPRNQRVLLDEYSRQRGQISAGGQLLAYSVSTQGRFRFLRVYPNPMTFAPVTGFYSLSYSSTGLERAEDTARILDVNYHMLLEQSQQSYRLRWEPLIIMAGEDKLFRKLYDEVNAENVFEFLAFSEENPS